MAKHGFDEAFRRDITGVKVCSIIILIIGIIATILSIFIIVSGPLVSLAATDPNFSLEFAEDFGFAPSDASVGLGVAGVFLTVMGIVLLVSSVLEIVTGGLGLHGAKYPEHITPFWVLSIIALVCSCGSAVVSIVMTALSGGDLGGNLVSTISSAAAGIVFDACCVFYAGRVRSLVRSGYTLS